MGSGKFENPDAVVRCALLRRVKTIAVIGLSPNPTRPSYGVSQALQGFGCIYRDYRRYCG
jgi:predicted CoA-binding protein